MICSVLCISYQVKAHQPDLSSLILAEQAENKWVLQLRSALTAFEYVIEEQFGTSSYATPEEFQELVVNYVRDNVSILFNDANVAILQHGMVKLGHETNVIFQLEGTPAAIHSIAVENKSFSKIARNKGVLVVYKKGFLKDQFTLNDDNGHRIKLKVGEGKFEELVQDQSSAQFIFILFAIVLIVLSIIFLVYQKSKP